MSASVFVSASTWLRLSTLAAQIEASSAIGSLATVPKCWISFDVSRPMGRTRSTTVPFALFLFSMVPFPPLSSLYVLGSCPLQSRVDAPRRPSPRRRNTGKQRGEAFRHRRVREDGVAQTGIRQASQHRRLHRGHDLTRFGAKHREAENAVAVRVDERLHEAAALSDRPRPQHRTHWQLRNAHPDAAAVRLRFAQADSREWRVGEHAERDEPVAGGAMCSCQVVADDAEIIERHVRTLWAPGAARPASRGPCSTIVTRLPKRRYV